MKLIQIILVPFLLLTTTMYFAQFRSRLFDRLIVVAIGALGVLMILAPDLANQLAHLVGVGRGADLVMYLGLTGLAFLGIVLYSKLRELERKLTIIARTEAIKSMRRP